MRLPFSKDVLLDGGDTKLTGISVDYVRIHQKQIVVCFNGGKTKSIPTRGLVQADQDTLSACMGMLRQNLKEEFEDGTVTERFNALPPEEP